MASHQLVDGGGTSWPPGSTRSDHQCGILTGSRPTEHSAALHARPEHTALPLSAAPSAPHPHPARRAPRAARRPAPLRRVRTPAPLLRAGRRPLAPEGPSRVQRGEAWVARRAHQLARHSEREGGQAVLGEGGVAYSPAGPARPSKAAAGRNAGGLRFVRSSLQLQQRV